MDNAEQLDFVSTTDAGEPDHQARHMGRAKYAIVLFGERDEVVGWGYDEEGAIKMLKRSTSWSGVQRKPMCMGHCSTTAIALVVPPFSEALSDNFG